MTSLNAISRRYCTAPPPWHRHCPASWHRLALFSAALSLETRTSPSSNTACALAHSHIRASHDELGAAPPSASIKCSAVVGCHISLQRAPACAPTAPPSTSSRPCVPHGSPHACSATLQAKCLIEGRKPPPVLWQGSTCSWRPPRPGAACTQPNVSS
eukprot:11109115-Lingulodinium_polyedra.AAC.1